MFNNVRGKSDPQKNLQMPLPTKTQKTAGLIFCSDPGHRKYLPADEFYKRDQIDDKKSDVCKNCIKARQKLKRQEKKQQNDLYRIF